MLTFRPLEARDYLTRDTRHRWRRSQFSASWGSTRTLLTRELQLLGARNAVIQVAVTEDEIRVDGSFPLATARPSSPTVVVAWQDNVRAIALGLESLRRVDRYGITKRGEQYAGWRALPSGEPAEAERGRALINAHGSVARALKATHPDHGGSAPDFHAVQAARQAATSVR